ncbi:MAG: mechanosensitive ion channel family protein [Candidatus Rokubacteria bacterium]|nr:mechanosensitive ion channel family protein [Candidatus Rokubacteria bacterium]
MMETLAEALGRWLGKLLRLEGPLVALLVRVVAIGGALVLAVIAYRAISHLIDRVLRPLEGTADYSQKAQRARTLGPLLKSATLYLLAFLALMVTLREIGIDIQAILVSAGVVGLAIGLGAQSLIKDVITGFFLLFEGLIAVGDVIEIGNTVGTVEAVGLRVTQIRTLNGSLRMIPNGEFTQFANYNRGWARAVVDVGVAWEEDVHRALDTLESVGRRWAEETGLALETPQAQGIVRFGDAEIVLRLQVRVPPPQRVEIENDLRRRIIEEFRSAGIRTPKKLLYVVQEDRGGAA